MSLKLIILFHLVLRLDDEERLREELKDLIDDNPIEEDDGSGDDSDTGSGGDDEGGGSGKKRKKHEDDDLDDRLEDDDYDLIEENLGVKVERRVGGTTQLLP